jgi:hypothetical protein
VLIPGKQLCRRSSVFVSSSALSMLSHANDNAFMLAEWLYLGADAPMSQS